MATARQLPADVYPETLSRLPPLKRETLNEAQQKAYDAVTAPRSGRLNLAGIKGPGRISNSAGEIDRLGIESLKDIAIGSGVVFEALVGNETSFTYCSPIIEPGRKQ